jgi:hypothetical protein
LDDKPTKLKRMKKIFITLLTVFACYSGFSQIYVGDVNINKKQNITYVELVGVTKNFNLTVYVDYGQVKPKAEEIRDKNGTIARSANIISALNLMTKNGWEFVTSYGYGTNNENVIKYLLKKEK